MKSVFLIIITASLSFAAACNNKTSEIKEEQNSPSQTTPVKRLNSQQFKALLEQYSSTQLIDVRTEAEFKSGHLENAQNIDYYNSEFKALLDHLKKDEPVFVYCAVGGRSAEAAKILQQQGFTEVIELEGGINDWTRNGNIITND